MSHGLLKELAKVDWLSTTHYAIQGISQPTLDRTYPQNIKVHNVIEHTMKDSGFGFENLATLIEAEKPHIVLIYNDMSIIEEYVNQFHKAALLVPRRFKLWVYLDQVYTSQIPQHVSILNRDVDHIFTFTKEWKEIIEKNGVTRPINVMAHGFESSRFIQMTKHDARKFAQIPTEAFVFLSVNRNQPRKRYDILIMAFVELLAAHPSLPLFLMCICNHGTEGGFPLFDIYARELTLRKMPIEQFSNRLVVSSNSSLYKDAEINMFYNLADVGVSCAEAEGFGLCAFEQMGVGIPQVLSDVVGHREYCNDTNSTLVQAKTRSYIPLSYSTVAGEAHPVDYRDFAKGMERYVLNRDLLKEHGDNARDTVLRYTWTSTTKSLMRHLRYSHEELNDSV